MSHDQSRKTFLTKVLGMAAAGALAPAVIARAASAPEPKRRAVTIRPDARTVAQRGGKA